MGQWGWTEVSGEGEALIDSGFFHQPFVLLAHIGTVTSSRVRVLGSADPRRVQYGGSVGYAGTDTDHLSATVSEIGTAWHLNFERQAFMMPALDSSISTWSDRVWWRLPPGITWWLEAMWNL